ncbi:MAG: FkbM family methyltransferase [bacterium]
MNKKTFRRVSYSQSGEDLIVERIFRLRGINKPSYLDIGAFHPYKLNNTAILYEKGSRGINIEPNPDNYILFKKYRKKDINLNIGISDKNSKLLYYIFNIPTLNTFSEEEAIENEKQGYKIIAKTSVKTKTINEVVKQFMNNIFPEFLSIDTEGFDQTILETIDFDKYRPKVICIESRQFSTDGNGSENDYMSRILNKNSYMKFADTYLNSIYVLESFWRKK